MTAPLHVPDKPALSRYPRLAAAILPVLLTGVIWSLSTQDNITGWYAGLAKPAFNPPNWAFPLAWTILYGLIAVSAWRLLGAMPRNGPTRE